MRARPVPDASMRGRLPDRLPALLSTLVMLGGVALAPTGRAESAITLLAPASTEGIVATTFDTDGQAIGRSSFEVEANDDGSQRMKVRMAVSDGGENVSEVLLAPVAGAESGESGAQAALRVLEERSQSRSADGKVFPLLVVDHRAGRVSCYDEEDAGGAARHVEIPDDDRVLNVPMQLFFQPLVRGEVDTLQFQLATCKEGPVLHSMIAVRGATRERNGRSVVEIEYGPDFGRTIAMIASRLLPSFSFWFDAEDGEYLGHRMPLHRQGPEVTLVRQGLTPEQIGAD